MLCLSSTSLNLSMVQAMLMLSRIAFFVLSPENRAADLKLDLIKKSSDDHTSPDLEMGPIQARSRGCVASCRYLSNFASSTFIARLVLKFSKIIILILLLHSMLNV